MSEPFPLPISGQRSANPFRQISIRPGGSSSCLSGFGSSAVSLSCVSWSLWAVVWPQQRHSPLAPRPPTARSAQRANMTRTATSITTADIDIFDIQLVAGRWDQTGTWTGGGDAWLLTGNAGTDPTDQLCRHHRRPAAGFAAGGRQRRHRHQRPAIDFERQRHDLVPGRQHPAAGGRGQGHRHRVWRRAGVYLRV